MKAILIMQNSLDPSNATTLRQCSFCKLLKENHYDVEVICMASQNNNQLMDGITFHVIKICNNKCLKYLLKYLFLTKYAIHILNQQEICPDLIHTTRIPLLTFLVMKLISKKYNVKLSYDSVEWFSIDEVMGGGYFDIVMCIEWILENIRIRFLIDRPMHIFSISSYLDHYFHQKNISTYRLPVVLDSHDYPLVKQLSNSILGITYAGSPGRKDYLKEIVMAVEQLTSSEQTKIEFVLFGVDSPSLAKLSSISLERMKSLVCIRPFGRVEKACVLQRLQETDFTILIRSSTARYAKAGFPTKVVESLMSSTPVICNMTSDLGMYLKDGYDCIEVKDESPEEIAKALRRALALTPEEKDQMKKNARKTAEENFDYRLYVESFGKFIRNEE